MQPLIAALLASPAHGLLSRDVLLMTWTGRKSGRRYTLPLSYVEQGGKLYLCTRGESSQWWRNLKGGAEVELRLRGRRVDAVAAVLDADSPEALDGLRAFVTRNPRTGEMLYHVARDGGAPREGDVQREVANSIVVRLALH
jgi:deazaflavin-dependent oxidoreductase (nitroreductase family)